MVGCDWSGVVVVGMERGVEQWWCLGKERQKNKNYLRSSGIVEKSRVKDLGVSE